MRPIHSFTIRPALPDELERLRELAHNLFWAWDPEAVELFRRLDPDLWEETNHNPVLVLGTIRQGQLEAAARDDGFLSHLERVGRKFDAYVGSQTTWYRKTYGEPTDTRIAYFSAEFGLTECLPIYSGGLGVLAGDHLKSASDLDLPLVGVGLFYQEGYFRQYLSADGWQQESYPINDFYNLPCRLEVGDDGEPVTIELHYPGRSVVAQIWRVQVGRIPLFLLDTNVPQNSPEDRDLTDELYGGDADMRIRQEIILGIGGLRALDALGRRPTVCHINEGHAAFLSLERIRVLMQENGLAFAEAREAARAGSVFTTHTPVPAGIDRFWPDLMDRYFSEYYPQLGLSRDEFLALGRLNPADGNEPFNMAVLAMRLAAHTNAVSELHGQVSRRMWMGVWPGVPEPEVPIEAITNGIHTRSWISHEMEGLFDRYLGPRWQEDPADPRVWNRVSRIPDAELWRTHERRREHLVTYARRRLRRQFQQWGASPSEIEQAGEALDPEALTIGFARRFATYKRATLLLRDRDRLAAILDDEQRPVQVIFAGKAHPRDEAGKDLIRQIVHAAREDRFRRRIVFLEDYDIALARHLVQGVDVWLNTPRRPREASGTSGMKAAVNGAINVSILDGWWAEGYRLDTGWAIGHGEAYDDPNHQDDVESKALYNLLEKEVVPLFYSRGRDGLPRGWIARMKASIRSICPYFNTHRMVRDYAERCYLPAARRYAHLAADRMARARALAAWKARLNQLWPQVRVENVQAEEGTEFKVGAEFSVHARIHLGELEPADVAVELYYGTLDVRGEFNGTAEAVPMTWQRANGDGSHDFAARLPCRKSGRHGYGLRILPRHDDLGNPYETGLILWAG